MAPPKGEGGATPKNHGGEGAFRVSAPEHHPEGLNKDLRGRAQNTDFAALRLAADAL
jgi:hypothetical protein